MTAMIHKWMIDNQYRPKIDKTLYRRVNGRSYVRGLRRRANLFCHPPAFQVHCMQEELTAWTCQAAIWVHRWTKGDTAPFADRLPEGEDARFPATFWSPTAHRIYNTWNGFVAGMTQEDVSRHVANNTADRLCLLREKREMLVEKLWRLRNGHCPPSGTPTPPSS
jgi:hypothetical protein